jgi:8-oxo-dGTP pyrophosphatase MutT (NUDIX family)
MSSGWRCLDDGRRDERGPRWPVWIDGRRVGSVSANGRAALAAWPQWLHAEADGALTFVVPRARRDEALAEINASLRAQGLIRAWRDEPFAWWDDQGVLAAVIERASSRFWGALTLGAHANGYVADAASGRPTHLWIARRAFDKPTDPGRLDNLIGAGVPHGQTPHEALQREAWEEAGLLPDEVRELRAGRVVELACDIPEGWQHEWLYVFDLAMPAGRVPQNQDGEVHEHRLMPVDEALRRAAGGEMTTDAALATLDFALRHGLLPAGEAAALAPRFGAMCVDAGLAVRFEPSLGSRRGTDAEGGAGAA